MIFVMKEHVSQCNGLAHWSVIEAHWTMELCGTEESGFGYIFMGFVVSSSKLQMQV